MADIRTWSHDFIKEFIEIYRSNPCLYDPKNKQYTNREYKNVAYYKLVDKVKEIDEKATKDTVLKKINNMRSSYRKELKKVEKSKLNGSGKTYEPSLWYFHELDFLYDQENPRKIRTSSSSNTRAYEDEIEEAEEDEDSGSLLARSKPLRPSEDEETISRPIPSCNTTAASSRINVASSTSSGIANRKRKQSSDEISDLCADRPKCQPNPFINFGAYVAEELGNLPQMMATYCQKLINDAIFEAKCGTLTRKARIVIDP